MPAYCTLSCARKRVRMLHLDQRTQPSESEGHTNRYLGTGHSMSRRHYPLNRSAEINTTCIAARVLGIATQASNREDQQHLIDSAVESEGYQAERLVEAEWSEGDTRLAG